MPIPADILTQLADVLAELYNDPASARTMAITAGLRVERIAVDTKPLNYWVAILGEAEAYGATQILLDRAVAQYPVHAPLAALHQAYTAWLLPPLPPLDLPDTPYRYLDWYRREDAEVFFGRGREIRMLVERVSAADGPPIVLLYGQSGVGKSSLLEAGLLPRIDGSRSVHYLRRDLGKGLLGTVTAALDASPGDDLAATWFRLEAQNGRPLLVILDQVEEVYTRPNPQLPDELADFLTTLEGLFADARRRPQGRLILGFRKEWLAEINRCLDERKLPRDRGVFLERLGRAGIAEVVAGPQSTPRLRSHFGLDVTATLPGLIADDLLADRESPVAPMLAILLTDMWDAAKKHRYDHPTFDEDLYHDFRRRGLSLDDFLGRQLRALQDRLPEVVDSGLVLDLLAYHTTPLGTAAQRTLTEIEETYRHRQDVLPALVLACQDLYLLVDPSQNQPNQPRASRLAHDTLAPHVRKRFEESDAPGQRARRIVESRAVDWQTNADGAPLDESDLRLVTGGVHGMRGLSDSENRLLSVSRHQSTRRARRSRFARLAIGTVILLTMVSLATAWLSTRNELRRTRALQLRQRAVELTESGNAEDAIAALRQAAEADPSQGIDLKVEEDNIRREVAIILTREGEEFARMGQKDKMRQKFEAARVLNPPVDTPGYSWIEPGEVIIGSPEEDKLASPDEIPQRRVTLQGYWISRTEITNAQYEACMKVGVCEKPKNDSRYLESRYASYPVTGVTLDQARTYAQWVGGRLPTEWEWEKACRGPGGNRFPWGNELPKAEQLNYALARKYTWESVGKYEGDRSHYGVMDMAGNVSEWTDSKFITEGRTELYVIRGGSYGTNDINAIRCANRQTAKRSAPDVHVGLRVVQTE